MVDMDSYTSDERRFYVYALIDPLEKKPFYIGKGKNNRIKDHFNNLSQDQEKENIIESIEDNEMIKIREGTVESDKKQRLAELFSIGYEFSDIARIIAVNLSEESAFAIETLLIKTVYGFDNLTNQVHGHYKEKYRDFNDWTLIKGLDYFINGKKKPSSRDPLLKSMLLSEYDKPLIQAASLINWINFDDPKILDSGELGIEGDYKGTRIKIAIKKQIYTEIRPRKKTQKEWMKLHFENLGLQDYLRRDCVYYPKLGKGKNRMKLTIEDVVKRTEVIKNILDASSYSELSLEAIKLIKGEKNQSIILKHVEDIQRFAEEWLVLYQNPLTETHEIEKTFGDECFKLKFVMDCGESFSKKYPEYNAMYKIADLKEVIGNVDDVDLLGSLIFSKWRGITHWSQEDILSDENRKWFVVSFTRLVELAEGIE